MAAPARFLPHNVQEFDNDMRALIVKHMGTGGGNPTQWVVDAVHEAFQAGFDLGIKASHKPAPSTGPSWMDVKPPSDPGRRIEFLGPEPSESPPVHRPVPPDALPPGMRRIAARPDDIGG